MNARKLWIRSGALACLLVLVFSLEAQSIPPKPSKAYSVAILLPRTVQADGWTRSGYNGLRLIEKELGASVAYSENVSESDFEAVFKAYAKAGYSFIIGHGAQFIAAAERAAAAYPLAYFAVVGAYAGNNSNLGGISLRDGDMGYLFGAIAAIKTMTKRVAYLGGAENPSNREVVALFKRGVHATDPSVQVSVVWVGNFTDSSKAEGLARDLITGGTDIIFVLAGAAGTGVHALAEKSGIYTLGWIEDLHSLAPKAVITSNIQDYPSMFLHGARLAQQGRWEGKQYRFGLEMGTQRLAPFNGLLTAEQEARVKVVNDQLIAGLIDTAP